MRTLLLTRTPKHGLAIAFAALMSSLSAGHVLAQQPSAQRYNQASSTDFGDNLTLDWRVPSQSCPSRDAFLAHVRELVGQQAVVSSPLNISVDAWRGEDALWHVKLVSKLGSGSHGREIQGKTCRLVLDAGSLAVALLIDPEAVVRRQRQHIERSLLWPERPDPSPQWLTSRRWSPVLPAFPAAALHLPAVASPERSSPWHAGASLLGGLRFALPTVSPGVDLSGHVTWSSWTWRLGGTLWASHDVPLSDHPGVGATVRLWETHLDACYRYGPPEPWKPSLCAAVYLGRMSVSGYGVRSSRQASSLWLAPGFGLDWNLRLYGPLAVRVHAVVLAPLMRDHYEIQPYGDVFRPASLTGSFFVGPSFEL